MTPDQRLWISFGPQYQRDLRRLGKGFARIVETELLPEIRADPEAHHPPRRKRLQGYHSLYRIRFKDNYRLVYGVFHEKKGINIHLITMGPRDTVYQAIPYDPEKGRATMPPELVEAALHPGKETPDSITEIFAKAAEQRGEEIPLPYILNDRLLAQWGIPQAWWEYLKPCRTESDLLALSGTVPDEVLTEIIDLVSTPSQEMVLQEPRYLLTDPEELIRYAQGDLVRFLLYLDEEQRAVVDWALDKGPVLVRGGAGTGKSTVALYRIERILSRAAERGDAPPRVLFLTYTNALVEDTRQRLEALLGGLPLPDISTLDSLALRIVGAIRREDCARGAPGCTSEIVMEGDRTVSLQDVVAARQQRYADLAALPPAYLVDEIRWVIEGQGITTLEGYLHARREGRALRFPEAIRRVVWKLYEDVLRTLAEVGKGLPKPTDRILTWGQLRQEALAAVRAGRWHKRWDYVFVDEAQDLPPVALALAVEVCRSPEGVFLAADASQSIYNRGFAWNRVHESLKVVGRTRILRRNYRTSRQIAMAANRMLANTGAGDDAMLAQEYVYVGPRPKIFAAPSEQAIYNWLIDEIQGALRALRLHPNSVGVFVRTGEEGRRAARLLRKFGLPAEFVVKGQINHRNLKAKVLTAHAGKGLEFPVVAIPHFEEDHFPLVPPGLPRREMRAREDLELRLAYVAMTRAMRRLFIAYLENQPSRFTALLDDELWEQAT